MTIPELTDHQIYTAVKDLATFVFTTSGLVIAGMGLSVWRKQIKGGKEFEIAYNLNYSVLKMREAIKLVRSPAIWANETNEAIESYKKKYPSSTEKEQQKNAQAHIYEIRWKKISEAYTAMESHMLGAEILWGKEAISLVRPMKTCVRKLNAALYEHLNLEPKDRKDSFDIVYDTGSEDKPDEFAQKVQKAVEEVSEFIKSKKVI